MAHDRDKQHGEATIQSEPALMVQSGGSNRQLVEILQERIGADMAACNLHENRDETVRRENPGRLTCRVVGLSHLLTLYVLVCVALGLCTATRAAGSPGGISIERFPSTVVPDTSIAVRVLNASLAHTTQLFPDSTSSPDAATQVSSLLAKLQTILRNGGSTRRSIVKLNVYVRDSDVRSIFLDKLSSWSPDAQPTVAFVATPLPDSQAVIALDAVFAVPNISQTGGPYSISGEGDGSSQHLGRTRVLPPGDVVYVSGQAAAGELPEATTETLNGLLKTINALGLERSHIVQIKTFMTPMSKVSVVDREIAAFFGESPVPPVSHVEWLSGSRPIEIELVAWAPSKESESSVSYFTPAWMKSSPVFSRVARIHGNDRVYVSGIEATSPGDGSHEVRSVFQSLQAVLSAAGSDIRHLAKATYYVSGNDSSSQLNALRPTIYDRDRPPAASKAMVADVGSTDRTISVDMIAAVVPASESAEKKPGSSERLRITAEVDFGIDRGQSFGSLFEIRNGNGRVVAGAGFADVYNTRFRVGRRTLQFFVRPETGEDEFEIERLPHPGLGAGEYLFSEGNEIYAWSYAGGNSVRRWNAATRQWVNEKPPEMPTVLSGDVVMRVGNDRLICSDRSVWYKGQQILSPPEVGGYYSFYYAEGTLFFYHKHSGTDDAFSRIYACPLAREDAEPIDLTKAVVIETKYPYEFPYIWAQYEGQVLTTSNVGGIYVFEDGTWRTVLEADDKVSYQLYSALRWHDRLMLAQYPTGNLFEYRGQKAVHLKGWPPVMPGVSTSAREAQTLAIYRGELLAGVWPWAELWRLDADTKEWDFMDRVFTHPELTAKQTHPYEAESKALGLVANFWGQRVTGMIPLGDSLIVSTSAKGLPEWEDRFNFLNEDQKREYGSVLKLRMSGNLAVQPDWKAGPAQLEFEFDGKQLTIRQDGKQLGAAAVGDSFAVSLSDLSVNWSQGVFGPLSGKLIRSNLQH